MTNECVWDWIALSKCPMLWYSFNGATDDRALLRSKYATYSGLDGSLLVLQKVSIADYCVMVFVTGTN
jgi:hypothetical protein